MALIKCPDCGKEVSTEAAACPQCGYPVARVVKASDELVASFKNKKTDEIGYAAGCFIILLAAVLVVGGLWYSSTGQMQPQRAQSHLSTKAELGSKIRPYESRVASASDFKALFGEPSRTQRLESTAYWYYDCSDGMLQIELISPDLTGGQIAITSANEY